MTVKNNNIPFDKMELYKKIIETVPKVELKGATMPYTSHNGHMFSFLDKEGNLGLRLPTKERDQFIAKFKTKLCEAHGAVLKEYVLVPESLFANPKEITKYFAIGFTYVSSLKPKKTRK
ncbi:MAG: hypothetical protein L0Y35_00225 [Flammeovirgaceae bacterium]|nr:hypothetical protein [Flammeovirgaceae bacterium]